MKVEIRPIQRKTWHGKTGKESFDRTKKTKALVDPTTMKYAVDLTEEDIKKYGELLKVNLSLTFNPDTPHEFWDSNMATVELPNATMFYDLDNPLHYVKYKIIRRSKAVANSMAEYNEGLWPDATHVIFSEEEEVQVKATQIELNRKLIELTSALSEERKIQAVMVVGGKNLRGKSRDFVEVELDKLINSEKKRSLLEFLQKTSEQALLEAVVHEALDRGILRKEGHKFMYFDAVLGTDVYDVTLYFQKPENQELLIKIRDLLG